MGATPGAPAPSTQHGFMRSTWHLKPKSEYTRDERMLDFVQPNDAPMPPVRTGKLPVLRTHDQWIFLAKRAGVPVVLQLLSQRLLGINWHPAFATGAYLITYLLQSKHTVTMAVALAQKWGYLDGEHARDRVPDVKVGHLAAVFRIGTFSRILSGVLLLYKKNAPVTVSLLLPLKAALFALIIDGLFYAYHFSSHNFDCLWFIHKTHHYARRPTPILSILATSDQELVEVYLIPLVAAFVTSKLIPFSFHEWFIASCGVISVELLGHSGVRAQIEGFLTAPFLRPFGLELCVADHDEHHRHGWRKATNYGKQSRAFDWIAGTMGERGEASADRID